MSHARAVSGAPSSRCTTAVRKEIAAGVTRMTWLSDGDDATMSCCRRSRGRSEWIAPRRPSLDRERTAPSTRTVVTQPMRAPWVNSSPSFSTSRRAAARIAGASSAKMASCSRSSSARSAGAHANVGQKASGEGYQRETPCGPSVTGRSRVPL